MPEMPGPRWNWVTTRSFKRGLKFPFARTVETTKSVEMMHCPNPGGMRTCLAPNICDRKASRHCPGSCYVVLKIIAMIADLAEV